MNHILKCPQGLEIWVQRLQEELYEYLRCHWELKESDYECYGLVHRNKTEKGYAPEAFTGGKDYQEVLLNDKLKVLSFFGVNQTQKADPYKSFTAELHLVLFVDLSAISCGGDKQQRKAEQARMDVHRLLRLESHQMTNTGIVTGVERVLEEYPGLTTESLIKFDQHPYHTFRCNMTCTYDPNTN